MSPVTFWISNYWTDQRLNIEDVEIMMMKNEFMMNKKE